MRSANVLRKRGMRVLSAGLGWIWLRRGLRYAESAWQHWGGRFAKTGEVMIEAQAAALKRKQDEKAAHGEIETAYPDQLVSQSALYAGTINASVASTSRVDTYLKLTGAKLYGEDADNRCRALYDPVPPLMEEQGMQLRIRPEFRMRGARAPGLMKIRGT